MAGGLKQKMLAWQDRIAAKYGTSITTPEARRAAWWHFQLMDHAFLRAIWTNLHQIAPGVWRANQPSPRRLGIYQRKLGLKSVVNLRGGSQQGFYLFEAEICQKLGLTLHDVHFSARKAPKKKALLAMFDLFETLQKPVLIHCKSGADRTGLIAALYLLDVEHRSIDEAKQQLSFRYLHLKSTQTGIMDHFLTRFEAEAKGRSIRDWVVQDYDPTRLSDSFAAMRGKRT
jgi:protein tyrosine/serine phosphatase